jgi:hypothetical protein
MSQILHLCCFTFLEVEGTDADIGVIYEATIVKFYVPTILDREIQDLLKGS